MINKYQIKNRLDNYLNSLDNRKKATHSLLLHISISFIVIPLIMMGYVTYVYLNILMSDIPVGESITNNQLFTIMAGTSCLMFFIMLGITIVLSYIAFNRK